MCGRNKVKNTIGTNVTFTIFGESHGEYIGMVLDGISPGVKIDYDFINKQMAKRRPKSAYSTSRVEKDEYKIISGVFNGFTTGTPICALIPNSNVHSSDYEEMKTIARPSHADYTANEKYHSYQDYRGGGHFSGRLTSAIVLGGAIAQMSLKKYDIKIATHIKNLHGIEDRDFAGGSDIELLGSKEFPVLDDVAMEKMQNEILSAKEKGDSVGGITETVILGLGPGLGEPMFDSIESVLSHAIFSIPGIKGISFGLGFDFASKYGSEANDPFRIKDGKVVTETNNNGGINGGITNGMDVTFSCAVKPTPSISKEQKTIDFDKKEDKNIQIKGRHDPAIIHRICPVIDAMSAICLCDILSSRYGDDYANLGK